MPNWRARPGQPDPDGGRRHPEPRARPAGGRRQRAGRPAGAGRHAAGAAGGRGDVRAAADAVQRRGASAASRWMPPGGCAARRRSARPACSSRTTRRRRGSPRSSPPALADLPAAVRRDDGGLEEAARAALRRALGRRLGKRPMVDVHLLRLRPAERIRSGRAMGWVTGHRSCLCVDLVDRAVRGAADRDPAADARGCGLGLARRAGASALVRTALIVDPGFGGGVARRVVAGAEPVSQFPPWLAGCCTEISRHLRVRARKTGNFGPNARKICAR